MNKELLRAKVSKKIFIIPGIFTGFFLFEAGVFISIAGFSSGLIPLIIAALIITPALIKYFYTNLILYDKKIRGEVGFFKSQTLDAPLDKINDVYVSQGILGRMLGYGNICISTSSSAFKFKGILYADFFKNKVLEQIEIYKKEQIENQAKLMAKDMKNINK